MNRYPRHPLRLAGCALLLALISCTARQPVEIGDSGRIGTIEQQTSDAQDTQASRQTRKSGPDATPRAPGEKETLAQYEALLAEETDPARRAELARRAAELRLQLATAEPADIAQAEPQKTNGNTQETITLLESSLSPQAGTAGNDQILYQMARAYDLAGDTGRSHQALTRLITEHPQSELHNEALFRRAEQNFVLGNYRRAEADYLLLLSTAAASPFSGPARHKLAWAIFKQGRYREALNRLLGILDEQITAARLSADGSRLNLEDMQDPAARKRLEDSVRVTTLCYALLGGVEHIPQSLRGHNSHYRSLLYLRLAGLYEERGHPEEAIGILGHFIDQHPDEPAVVRARHRMIALLDQSGDSRAALRARERFAISQTGSEDPEVRDLVRDDMLLLTRHYHAQAQKPAQDNGGAAAYREAVNWYRRLLQAFPEQHEQRFLLAELLLDHGDYLDAARQFERLGYETPAFEKAEKAAYAALVARREAGRNDDEAAMRFTRQYPQHIESTKILATTAENRFAQKQYAPAIEIAERVLQGKAPHSIRMSMLSLIAHARFEQGDYRASEETARRWLNKATQENAHTGDMRNLLASSVYRQAQQAKKAAEQDPDKVQAAIDLLLSMRSLPPADADDAAGKLRASAALQAAQLQLDSRQWRQAAATLEAMRRAFPGHPQKAEVARGLALAYEKQGQKKRAAEEYARFSQATDDPELQRAAAYQMAELHWQADRLEAARDAFRDYAHSYPRPLEDNMQAQQRLVEIYGRMKDERRYFWLKKLIETDAGAGGARSDVTRSLAARAALELADHSAGEYRQTALTMPLEKGIKRKQTALEKALAAYTRATDYSVADVTTAASYRIAELYRDFGRTLLRAPLPEDLADDERNELRMLLEEQAFPFEEKAIRIHEANLARHEQGLFDVWIGKSLQVLMELVPGRYAKREKGEHIVENL